MPLRGFRRYVINVDFAAAVTRMWYGISWQLKFRGLNSHISAPIMPSLRKHCSGLGFKPYTQETSRTLRDTGSPQWLIPSMIECPILPRPYQHVAMESDAY
jgi:hypothetical protein